MNSEWLAERTFTLADQAAFAALSGDCNPIHLDAAEARKGGAGRVVVHGVHLVLWGLTEALRIAGSESQWTELTVKFHRFVTIGDRVRLSVKRTAAAIELGYVVDEEPCAIAILKRDGTRSAPPLATADPEPCADTAPRIRNFSEMSAADGRIGLQSNAAVREAFPVLSSSLGAPAVKVMLGLTYIVGMICPGYYSVFGGFQITFGRDADPETLNFQVSKADARFNIVVMKVAGSGLSGQITAFARPRPVEQLSLDDCLARVRADEFKGRKAVVIGGSRGLGALTAKLIAAGGGSVTVTYHAGIKEAEQLANEINSTMAAGSCEIVQYDALAISDPPASLLNQDFYALFYFATGPILPGSKPYSYDKFQKYYEYYVSAFEKIVGDISASQTDNLKVFYPSTVFVDEAPLGLTEYAMAKAAGEQLCRGLSRGVPKLDIVVERLPRLKTDQTASMTATEFPDADAVILPILRRLLAPGR